VTSNARLRTQTANKANNVQRRRPMTPVESTRVKRGPWQTRRRSPWPLTGHHLVRRRSRRMEGEADKGWQGADHYARQRGWRNPTTAQQLSGIVASIVLRPARSPHQGLRLLRERPQEAQERASRPSSGTS
jgi:hypothetical protein